MKTRDSYKVIFILIIALAIYYPSLSAPLNPLDDVMLSNWLLNLDVISFKDIFSPTDSGYYYRPLLTLSFIFDKYFWGVDTSFMHLDNILLHALNAVMVFFIARKLFAKLAISNSILPLGAALLFVLHPLNTEAVNWISGRSDLIAGCFVLLSLLILLKSLESSSKFYCAVSYFVLILGCLAKETALFFMPAALIIIVCYDGRVPLRLSSITERIVSRIGCLIIFSSAVLVYFPVRLLALNNRDPGLSITFNSFSVNRAGMAEMVKKILCGAGFYLKKLFVPWPLNFAIDKVPEPYIILGLLLLGICVYFLHKRDLIAAFFMTAILIGSSALFLLVVRSAWTPVAERYMYIPTAFFSIAIVASVHQFSKKFIFQRVILFLMIVLYTATAYATFERNLVWHDNIRLFEDTVNKSPDFPFAKATLAQLLKQSGRDDEGDRIIKTNFAGKNIRNWEFLELQRAQLLYSHGKLVEARELVLSQVGTSAQLYGESRKLLVKINEERLKNASGQKRTEIANEIADELLILHGIFTDPFYYYQLGHIYLQVQNTREAKKYFTLAYVNAPNGIYYKMPARRLADGLKE